MITSINHSRQVESKIGFVILITLALVVIASAKGSSQTAKHNSLLSNVTFKSAYVIKADAESQKEEEARIFESLPSFNVTPTVKKNYAYVSNEGDIHIIRYVNQDQPEAGAEVCLTITDKLGNIIWEMKYHGQGMPGENDNFIAPTKDNKGYLIQRIVRRSSVSTSSTPETAAQ